MLFARLLARSLAQLSGKPTDHVSQNALEVARLCGQQIYTVEIFQPVRNIHTLTYLFAPGFLARRNLDRYAAQVYRCATTQLMNLGPRTPAVAGWPCYSWPPPLLLVGYQYFVAVCNDYNFDERAYSRIGFVESRRSHQQFLDWSCLANCTYSINAGAYLRFLDVDDFENTLTRIQQSLLADRIAADLQLADPMRGLGRWRLPGQGNNAAARVMEQELSGGGGAGGGDWTPGDPLPSLGALVVEHYRHLQDCGPEVWGLCYRTASAVDRRQEEEEEEQLRWQRQPRQPPEQQQQPYASDAQVLAAIRQLRSAYFRFRFSLWRHNNNFDDDDDHPTPTTNSSQSRYRGAGLPSWLLPETPVDVQDEDPAAVSLGAWLLRFVRRFQRSPAESNDGDDDDDDPMTFFTEPLGDGDPQEDELLRKERTRQMLTLVIDSLTLPRAAPPQQPLVGGARPRRPWRRGLRPRDPATGRAITQAMRRLRGENVRTFIASLPRPLRRRRRQRQQQPQQQRRGEDEEQDDVEEDDPLEGRAPRLVIDEEDVVDDEEDVEELDEDEMVELWIDEVRRTVAAAIERLEEALRQGPAARVERVFFEFPTEFYRTMQQLMDNDDVTEITLRRWTIYFFICEHIASTLNYLYARLRRQPFARRHLQLLVTQLVMRARDADGDVVFSRVWNEHGDEGFQSIMRRVVRDLTATVARAGAGRVEDDEGLEDFMNDIEWHENSGDVEEIIRQVTLNDADIDNIELSFRVKIRGPVALSGNQSIQTINRRVGIEVANRDRNRVPLPQLHEMVNLPPAPRAVVPGPRRNRPARGPPMGQRALSRRFRGGPRNL